MSNSIEDKNFLTRLENLDGLPSEDLILYKRIIMLYYMPGGSGNGLYGHLEESAKFQVDILRKYERLEERPLCCERNRFPIILYKS